MKKSSKLFLFSFIFIVLTFSFISASFGYNNRDLVIVRTAALNDLTDVSVISPSDGESLMYNSTSGEWGAETVAGSGDITSVTAGTGLTGGGDTGGVTLNVYADTCGANELSKYNGSYFACVTDQTGGAGGGQNTSGIYLYNDSNTHFFNTTLAGTNLSVNSSDFWDGLDSPLASWLNTTNLTYHAYNSTGLIRNWNASSLIINWSGNYLTLAELLGFSYYNATNFDIADYYLKSNPFSFWNSTFATFNKTYADTLYVNNNSAGWILNITGLWVNMFYTPTSSFEYTFDDDGNDIIMDFSSIGGTNSLFLETAGTFLEMIANPGPSNDYEMFAFEETQGDDTAINFYEGGVGHNRIWDSGSMRIGGNKSSLCSNITSDVDCNTASTGADLVVEDDGWFGGKLFSSDWANVSITETQISDLQVYLLQNNNTLAGNYSASEDFCIAGGACLSNAGGGSGDITAVYPYDSSIQINNTESGDVYIYVNETRLNNTIDNRENDTFVNADCPTGQFVQNISGGDTLECLAPSGSGDVTGVFTTLDNYLYNGSASGDIYLRFNETFAGINLAVNSSDFWDGLDSPLASWTNTTNLTYHAYNDTGLIIDWNSSGYIIDWSYLGGGISWSDAMNGTLLSQADFDSNYTDWNSSGYIIDWNASSFIIDWNATGLIANWSGNYLTLAQLIGFSYYNATNFDIADYSTTSTILGWNYWNDTYATFNKTYADTLYVDVGGDTMTGNLNINTNLSNVQNLNDVSGFINHTLTDGTIRYFSNGCYEKVNSTGLYWIC